MSTSTSTPGPRANPSTPSECVWRALTPPELHTNEERDGMLHSGMQCGLNQSCAALDALLERLA